MQPFLTAATILGVLAQRLVRKLCPHCKQEGSINEKDWEHLTFDYIMEMPAQVFKPVGCDECRQTGYKGRVGIYEVYAFKFRHQTAHQRQCQFK